MPTSNPREALAVEIRATFPVAAPAAYLDWREHRRLSRAERQRQAITADREPPAIPESGGMGPNGALVPQQVT
jgi:hypothetical protein